MGSTVSDPFDLMSKVTLTDPSGAPFFSPIPFRGSYIAYVMLMTVPRATGMSDGEALDYAERLGFTPDAS